MRVGLRRYNPGARGGFTLFELLIVMVIIAIAFFAVRPNFTRAVQADRERSTLRQVAAMLVAARTEAVARGRLVRVEVSAAELHGEVQSLPDYLTGTAAGTAPAPPVGTTVDDYRAQFDPLSLLGHPQLLLPDYLQVTGLLIAGMPASSGAEQVIYFYPDGHTSGDVTDSGRCARAGVRRGGLPYHREGERPCVRPAASR